MKDLNNIIFIWQLIVILITIIIIVLLIIIIKSQKDYNKIYAEAVSLIEFANKQSRDLIAIKKELKEKTDALNILKQNQK